MKKLIGTMRCNPLDLLMALSYTEIKRLRKALITRMPDKATKNNPMTSEGKKFPAEAPSGAKKEGKGGASELCCFINKG